MKTNDSRNWVIVFAVLGIGTYLARKMFNNFLPKDVSQFDDLLKGFYGMVDLVIYVSIFFVVVFSLLWLAGDKNDVSNRNGPKR